MEVKTFSERMNSICLGRAKSAFTVHTISLCIYVQSLLILLNHSIYYYMDSTKRFIQVAIPIWTMITFLVVTEEKRRCYKNIIVVVITSYLISILYFVASGSVQGLGSYIVRYFFFVPLMIIILDNVHRRKPFLLFYALSDIIYVIAAISLFFWIFASVIPIIPDLGWRETDWGEIMSRASKGGINYWYVYYEIQKSPSSMWNLVSYRNCGIFCEGPAYAFILSIALMTEHFLRDKRHKKRIFILWIVMFTTLTTSMILYIAVFAALKWYIAPRGKRRLKILCTPVLIVLFVCLIAILIEHKSNQASVLVRLNDYLNAFSAFINKPIFGYGYKFNGAIAFNAGITNSFSDTLIRGGIVLTGFYLIPLLSYPVRAYKRMIQKGNGIELLYDQNFVILIWATYTYLTTILTYTFILLSLVSYGYAVLTRKDEYEN